MVVPDTAFRIDEIMRRPILIVKSPPDRIVVVDRDRIGDLQIDTAFFTLSTFFSKANSGACTPITTRPWSLYFSAHALT